MLKNEERIAEVKRRIGEKERQQITNMVYRGKARLRGLLQREGITDVEK